MYYIFDSERCHDNYVVKKVHNYANLCNVWIKICQKSFFLLSGKSTVFN